LKTNWCSRRFWIFHVFSGLVLGIFPTFAAQNLPEKSPGVWLDVPYVKQAEDGCGSAAISMLLQYWSAHGTQIVGTQADPVAIQKQLYSPKARGIFASDMERYLRESGFREFAVKGEWGDLRQHLERGRPIILSIQPGSAKLPFHYVVVAGMDWEHEALFVNDPARGKLLRIERQEFEKEWQAARNWMLLAVPAASN
jgi:ABC-type bacteriocin/lantibiotic exporter with double-glycine peptidase domain